MLRIKALGGLSVERDGVGLTGAAAQPRRLALLALLARAGGRGLSRERAMAILWPETDDERARRALAQALYALRRDLGDEEAIGGSKELRLDAARVTSDVADLEAAIAEGSLERVNELYVAPFLDGFHVAGSAEFERWVDAERAELDRRWAEALEALVAAAAERGEHARAAAGWRRLAARDPLNARVAMGFMRALAASGDRAGALRHARIYEALLDEELALPPDREVIALARQLRDEAHRGDDAERARAPSVETPRPAGASPEVTTDGATLVATQPVAAAYEAPSLGDTTSWAVMPVVSAGPLGRTSVSGETYLVDVESDEPATDAKPRPRRRARTRRVAIGATATIVAVAALVAGARMTRGPSGGPGADSPVIAIGTIADRTGAPAGDATAAAVSDLLATNLARVPGLRVVSPARLLELARDGGAGTAPSDLLGAARRAGATVVVEGALFRLPTGRYRLDLRRVELPTGAIASARTVEGPDLFALADSGTAHVATGLRGFVPAGSVADVTTRSPEAYRAYAAGVRRLVAGHADEAEKLLLAAVKADSTFALAWYYLARATTGGAVETWRRMERARQLARRLPERERLLVEAGWARLLGAPSLRATAESLVARYPDEPEGYMALGAASFAEGKFVQAAGEFGRVTTLDSAGLRGTDPRCMACEALQARVTAYAHADSGAAAERVAREWTRLQPSSWQAWETLYSVLDAAGRTSEALAAFAVADSLDVSVRDREATVLASHYTLVGDYARAEEILRAPLQAGSRDRRAEALWYLALAQRQAGKLDSALATARRHRAAIVDPVTVPSAAPRAAAMEAQVLLELGRHRESMALFDSIARWSAAIDQPALVARQRLWYSAHAATAAAAAGDTVALARYVDTLVAYAPATLVGRDRLLPHYARGLLLRARGKTGEAIAELRQAIWSPTLGYTRVNAELARTLIAAGRRREAIGPLEAALRGGIESGNFYVRRDELRALLAQARQ